MFFLLFFYSVCSSSNTDSSAVETVKEVQQELWLDFPFNVKIVLDENKGQDEWDGQ